VERAAGTGARTAAPRDSAEAGERDMHQEFQEAGWWKRIVGDSRSAYGVRDRVHKELRRAQTVSDDAWINIEREFRKISHIRREAVSQVHRDIAQVKGRAKSFWKDLWMNVVWYSVLVAFIGPVVYGIWFIFAEHSNALLYSGIYVLVLLLFLLWALVVPSRSHKGISLFKPYELTPSEAELIKETCARAAKRIKNRKKQSLWAPEERDKPVFILSLDGGGIKGVVHARLLDRISQEFPGFMDRVSLVAGCSTGAIVAGMLTVGFLPSEVFDMFCVASPVVFRTTVWEQLLALGGLSGPQHGGEGKMWMLQTAYGDLRLRDLPKGLCVTASHVDEGLTHKHIAPRLWSNVVEHGDHGFVGHHDLTGLEQDDGDSEQRRFSVLDMKVSDVVHGATSAPTFFPAHQSHLDGGLWGNNPSTAALAHVLAVKDISKVSMLSMSTGLHVADEKCVVSGTSWGLKQWLPWIIDFLFSASMEAAHFNTKAMLQDRYHRIEPVLTKPVALNDVGAIDDLKQAADALDLTETFDFLESVGFKRRRHPSKKKNE